MALSSFFPAFKKRPQSHQQMQAAVAGVGIGQFTHQRKKAADQIGIHLSQQAAEPR